jgi:hypothetical protein
MKRGYKGTKAWMEGKEGTYLWRAALDEELPRRRFYVEKGVGAAGREGEGAVVLNSI